MNVMGLWRTSQVSRHASVFIRGFKSDVDIKWIRPERPPCFAPGPNGSGDVAPVVNPSPDVFAVPFQQSKSLLEADDMVKTIFSIDIQGSRAKHQVIIKNYLDLVKCHELDKYSPEAKIAKKTARIRYLQEHLEKCPLDKGLKIKCKELIDKRNKSLKLLRRTDYKKYEWILEKLDLVFKAPAEDRYEDVTRKKSLMRLVQMQCDEIKAKKMNNYKASLIIKKQSIVKKFAENPE
ncbi:28S ribosomal protein S15, mitochondrial [Arctopsyche grandis]|uniref:28S ribosomal protein S15, mitochondrial n=1 Tax=Arctopsyche grandis TaxID=121162 RepID=UPI00406D6941